jgi:hypothetical protein
MDIITGQYVVFKQFKRKKTKGLRTIAGKRINKNNEELYELHKSSNINIKVLILKRAGYLKRMDRNELARM